MARMTFVFWGTAALFIVWTASVLWHLRWVRRLPPLNPSGPRSADGPSTMPAAGRCSVVIAARDEEARIERTIRQLLAQRGVELEIIVVDDRSQDRTPEILRRLSAEDSRVQSNW